MPPSLSPQQQMQLQQAVALHQGGQIEGARRIYRQILLLQPRDADVLRFLGTAEIQLGNREEGVRLLGQSVDIQPNQPGSHHNRGNGLRALGRFQEAFVSYDKAVTYKPDYAFAWAGRGDALTQLGRLDEAVASYDRALALEPGFVDAHVNKGNALLAAGRFDAAAASFGRAVALQPDFAEGWVNQAMALASGGRLEEAAAAYARALTLRPGMAAVHVQLARLHERLGRIDQAVAQWRKMAAQFERAAGADLVNRLRALNELTRLYISVLLEDDAAEATARLSLSVDPEQLQVAQDFLNARMRRCAWPVVAPFDGVRREHLLKAMSPFIACAYTDDPMLQLAINRHDRSKDAAVAPHEILAHTPPAVAPTTPLRIGYMSSDLREHAFGYLTYEIPELHDRGKVEVFAYYCGPAADDAIHSHFKTACDRFTDISGMDDATAAARIQADGVQILIDCNGYTLHSRQGVLDRRPAPVIVNWLGFPGSMGSACHHYIIADDWTIPADSERYYSEKVVRLPCYQPNNRRRVTGQALSRTAAGLPDDAFVFCCFNGTQKITRHMFDRWLSILQRVPGSVLWLLSDAAATQAELRRHAGERGIDPARLVFAAYLPNAQHLPRYLLADLFLDTTPYNAHTTCSDALWMGLPVLTWSGRSFASRVCGSLIRSAGLPEMICASGEDYVDQAVALAQDPDRLRDLRVRLRDGRDTCPLFDTPLFVRRLEELFAGMWEDYVSGRLPQPDLRNLNVYLAAGIGHDAEAVEVQAIADYPAFWREQLARQAAIRPFGYDNRLWTAPD